MRSMGRMKRGLWLIFVVAAILAFIVAGAFGQAKKVQKRQIEIEHIQDIDNPNAGFKVELWTDKKEATYKVGDEIVFSFKTNKDCRLTLFNVATSGKVQILFPNEHQKDNLVKAGATYRIPPKDAKYLFKAQAPAGEDVVKAIATLEKVALVSQSDCKPAGDFQEVTKPESQVARDIGIALKPVDIKRWAEAEKIIKIVE
jgi:hypothetical protein